MQMIICKSAEFLVRHGKIYSVFGLFQDTICSDRCDEFHRLIFKQGFKLVNIESRKELFCKVLYLIIFCKVFFNSCTQISLKIVIKQNCMHG